MPIGPRSSNLIPSSLSSRSIDFERAGCEIAKCFAAFAKLPCSIIAARYKSFRGSMTHPAMELVVRASLLRFIGFCEQSAYHLYAEVE